MNPKLSAVTRFTRTTAMLFAACLLGLFSGAADAEPSHGIAMRGEPALAADFSHLPYVNPDAPQGGRLVYGVYGTFDDLNPFDIKSIRTGARGLWEPVFGNLVFESLLKRSRDEPFTLYGLLAEKVELPEDRGWMKFHLNPKAAFSDGQPVTVEDVLFTFELLREKGRPPFSSRMKQVERLEKTGERSFRITFNEQASRETPMLFGLMPVLPKHAVDAERFGESTLEPPIASGPYVVSDIRPGESITYTRNRDYWGNDLPVNRGFYNFDTIRVDYYRNASSQFEAFKKGLFDIYPESSPAKWRTSYDFAAVDDGRVVKESFASREPSGMLGLVFNTRREKFSNRNVRKALAMLFDFEWANENLFYDAYTRTSSYWQGSNLSSLGEPASRAERTILNPFPDAVPQDVMDGSYRAAVADGTGRDRRILRSSLTLLQGEGYKIEQGQLVDAQGTPLAFELLIAGGAGLSSQDMERLSLSYKRTAAKLGINIDVRFVDDSQFQARKGTFDFDMTITRYSSSLSPGAEQIYRWGSQSRDIEGSFNFAGVAEPAIDTAIERLLSARTEEDFTAAVRAYDRLLISGHYVVPLYHLGKEFIARWAHIERPEYTPLYGPQFPTWWSAKAR
ncbi:MAG: extracellular solute-binding protein [Ahrensia sp.]|nr:extracellular solute-binding protein [Ahrensia sp.]